MHRDGLVRDEAGRRPVEQKLDNGLPLGVGLVAVGPGADGGGVLYFPIDFDPSKLPIGGQLPSTGILPPMNPSPGVSGELPDDIANLPDLSDSDFEEKEGE